MTRSDRRRRVAALGALVVLVVAAFAWIGVWQWRVAVQEGDPALPDDPAVDVAALVPAGRPLQRTAVGREVVAAGRYGATLLVPEPAGEGWWVLAELRTDAGTVLPVVRGRTDEAAAPPAPAGDVEVVGRVQPPEVAPDGPALPEGQVPSVDTTDLVNRWGGPIHPAYVVAEQETPAGAAALEPVTPQPLQGETTYDLRNLAYAVQWWVFAAFAVVLWVRYARGSDEPPAAGGEPAPVPSSRHDPGGVPR